MEQSKFSIEQTLMISAQILNFQINDNQLLDKSSITGFDMEIGSQVDIREKEKLVKIVLSVELTAININEKLDYKAQIQGEFVFFVENFMDFIIENTGEEKILHGELGATLAGISYSTFRGMILFAAKGTVVEHFILPIINPTILIPLVTEKK